MMLSPFTVSAIIIENEPYNINGLNIWDWEWKMTGQRVSVNHNGKPTLLPVYEILHQGNAACFVAFELSNNVWRIDRPEE